MINIALMEEAATEAVLVDKADLASIVSKANRLVEVEAEIANLHAQLALLGKERERLRIIELPEMMFANGMTSVGVADRVVSIETAIQARAPKARMTECINYLIDIGEGGIVSRALELDLPKGDAVMEDKVCNAIRKVSKKLNPRIVPSIHWASYEAVMKRLVKAGQDIPKEMLGVFVGHIALVSDK